MILSTMIARSIISITASTSTRIMRYNKDDGRLQSDSRIVSTGYPVIQSQESLDDQLMDLRVLANRYGLNDAADFIRNVMESHAR